MDLWLDVRYAARRLAEARWFTLAAVVALSFGIGANTAVFTFVNAVLLRGLPFRDADRVVMAWTENERSNRMGVSLPDLRDWRESGAFESLAGALGANVNLSDDERNPERYAGAYVTGNFFRMLGEQPVLGRDFTDDDDLPSADPVVLLAYNVWRDRYASDPGVLGLTVRVNSKVATVVGVMGSNMRFPFNDDLWIPQVNLPPEQRTEDRDSRGFQAIGRLASGTTVDRARERLQALGARLSDEYPDTNAELTPGVDLYLEQVNGPEIRLLFLSLMGAVAFVLLIACANVANLLLAKSAERTREIAVRVSLGGTRPRIVRQLLIESLLVAVLAGALGLGLSFLGVHWFDSVTQNVGKPYWMVFSMDPTVFGFMALVCLGTAILFGLAPALHVSRTEVTEVLKEGSRGGTGGLRARRWAGALIIGEIALTLVLLSGAGFMMRSFLTLYSAHPGVDTDGLVTMRVYLPLTKYPRGDQQIQLYDQLLDRMADDPVLRSSALATAMPLSGGPAPPLELDGRAAEPGETPPQVTSLSVSERYFDVVGAETVQGRTFTREHGLPGAEVAVVNQRFVDLHLGDGDVLGRRIRLGAGPNTPADSAWVTVVGVIPNIRQRDLEEIETDPVAYVPLRWRPGRTVGLLVRSQEDPSSVIATVRSAMRSVEPDIPPYDIMTMEERLVQQRWMFRVFALMFSVFAAIALTLSAVGLYSITANSVVQRIREFGIRQALGAQGRDIRSLALRRVLKQLAIGLPLGALGAYAAGHLLASLLVRTSPNDLLTLGAVILVMVAVAIVACLIPARHAARIDPMEALRVE